LAETQTAPPDVTQQHFPKLRLSMLLLISFPIVLEVVLPA